jgi:hypothetical protein
MLRLSQAARKLQVHPDQLRNHLTGAKPLAWLPPGRLEDTSRGQKRARWTVALEKMPEPPAGVATHVAARRLKITPDAVRHRINRQQLPAMRWGGRWIVPLTALP